MQNKTEGEVTASFLLQVTQIHIHASSFRRNRLSPFFSFGECVRLTPAKASQLLAHICLSLTLADPLEKETV